MECLWYDGNGAYQLLDFDPDGLNKEELKVKVIEELRRLYVDESDIPRELMSVYLIKVDNLKRVFWNPLTINHIHN